jgi:hypothetical protein
MAAQALAITNARPAPPAPQSLTERLAELTDIADHRLADEDGGGWLARAIRDSTIAKLEENRKPESTTSEDIASLATAGLPIWLFLQELRRRFGQVSRHDVFLAFAATVQIMEARVTLAQLDVAITKGERANG